MPAVHTIDGVGRLSRLINGDLAVEMGMAHVGETIMFGDDGQQVEHGNLTESEFDALAKDLRQ